MGDVHGCLDELLRLLRIAGFNPLYHRLILLGDIINKGPQSLKTLYWAREQKADVLLGNHELKFLRRVEGARPLSPKLQQLKQQMGAALPNWLNWIKKLPVYIEEKHFLAIHGGLIPGRHPKDSKPEISLNIRYWNLITNNMQKIDPATGFPPKGQSINTLVLPPGCRPWHELYTKPKLVVYGHWARQGLKIKKNSIGLDTGCVYGGPLTGIWLPERKIIQTAARHPR